MSRLILYGITSWVILCSSYLVRADDTEDRAVEFVEKLGGRVIRNEKAPGKPVISLDLYNTQVTDAGLKELAGLKNLTDLVLVCKQETDAGLKELAGLQNLTYLELYSESVMDAGLKEFAALKNLTSLYLYNTKVTDAGMKELRKALPKCMIERLIIPCLHR